MRDPENFASTWNPRVPLPPDDPHQHRRSCTFCTFKLLRASRSPWKQEFWKTPCGGLGSARFQQLASTWHFHVETEIKIWGSLPWNDELMSSRCMLRRILFVIARISSDFLLHTLEQDGLLFRVCDAWSIFSESTLTK